METSCSFGIISGRRNQPRRERNNERTIRARQEHLEHAAHEHGHTTSHTGQPSHQYPGRRLAITEFASKDASSSYLTNHIAASNTWRNTRRSPFGGQFLTASRRAGKPTRASGPRAKRIADARANAERMRSNQAPMAWSNITEKAHEQEHERDHEMHP